MTTMAPDGVRLDDLRLYRVKDAMTMLGLGKTVIFEQIRAGRLRSVKQGRARLISATAIRDYISLLEKEAEESTR
ncbi:helix-turn-helix domain-containing protein [Streptosporangium sp. NPDC048047]|uniref:helix-turn-helix domain-containing protein n=1 Tax=Streptosporangium sp. NPDC048047 TaxID=3155748 RepID=UPI00344AB142